MTEKPEDNGMLSGLFDKAKEALTDERIDQAAEAIKSVAPDSVDRHVDSLADKAKQAND